METESLFELSFFKVGTPVKARIDPNVSPPAFLPSAAGLAYAEKPCTYTVGNYVGSMAKTYRLGQRCEQRTPLAWCPAPMSN